MNNMVRNLVAIAATALISSAVSAMPLYDGTYDLSNASNNSHDRGIWTNDGTFETDSGSTFAVAGDGLTALMSGSASRLNLDGNGNAGGFSFTVNYDFRCTSTVSDAGGKNVSVDNAGCAMPDDQPTGGAVNGSHVDGNQWDFWNMASGSLSGTGVLAGLEFDLIQAPTNMIKPFRVGIGANWDLPDVLGAAMWFELDCTSAQCSNAYFAGTKGDFNFSFTSVPAPGTLAIMGIGLFLLGAARRRMA